VSAIDLARRAGWPRSKVSKIEHARQTPTADDIRVWGAAGVAATFSGGWR
jgi:transcriptional regulator with XRE-family HTH domain